jgi:hypothetical protein
MIDALMARWKVATLAGVALFGVAAAPAPADRAAQMKAMMKAEVYADRFYKLQDCSAGMGFRYAVRDDGATYLVQITPPPSPPRRILKITVDKKRMRITRVEKIG